MNKLQGVRNMMPQIGGDNVGNGNGYVIIGEHSKYPTAPKALKINGSTFAIEKEDYDFMCRNLELREGQIPADLIFEDDSTEKSAIVIATIAISKLTWKNYDN
eukprot:Pgem_evm3s5589